MPNWCAGNIRFRGKREDILSLLKNEIVYCVHDKNYEAVEYPVDIDDDDISSLTYGYDLAIMPPDKFQDRKDIYGWYYIKGTKRAFLDSVSPNIYPVSFHEVSGTNDDPDSIWLLIFDGFKQAWGIFAENFTEMSKKYNVDIRIFGWEQGMEFSQEVEIIDGEVTKDISLKYDNWEWECPLSYMGG